VLASFVIAAVITPTPDVMAQTMLAIPMLGLYLIGIAVAWAFGRPRQASPAGE
jgi:sec-independent protein translocase protein TatC